MIAGNNPAAESVANMDLRLGKAIKGLRKYLRMTQSELAEHAQVSQSYISLTENGHRKVRPNLKMLQRIAYALGQRRLSDLIRFTEDMPDAESAIAKAKEYFGGYDQKSSG